MRHLRSVLLLTGFHLVVLTAILFFARADSASDYQLLFTSDVISEGPQIYTAHLDGSNLQQLSFNPNYDKGWHSCPMASPDGRWIASYSYYLEVETVYSLRTRWGTGEAEFSNYFDTHFCPGIAWANGWLYYLNDRAIYRTHPLYPEHPEVVIQSNIFVSAIYPSPDGQWLLQPSGYTDVSVYHTQHFQILRFYDVGRCLDAVWSPDGRYVVCQMDFDLPDLRLLDIQTAMEMYLVKGKNPAWSLDSQWIAFWQERDLWIIHPDGTGQEKIFTLPEEYDIQSYYQMTPFWLPDGEGLLLPELCIPGEYGSKCTAFRLSLRDRSLTAIQPIFQYVSPLDGMTEARSMTMHDLQLLPPLDGDFNPLPLILIGIGMLVAGVVMRRSA